MAIEQLQIREIVKQAVSKNVDVPEFQRQFVWDPEQVKKLAESLYRDYPIGSFLLWDSADYQESKTAQGAQASLWLVDGQQRTTGLCLLFGSKPYWWSDAETWNRALERYDVMVNLLPEQDEDRLEFALPNPIRRLDPRWVGVRRILSIEKVENLTPLGEEIATRNSTDPNQIRQVFGKVHARLHRLWQVREHYIPVVKISHEIEDVAEIFARLNQEGTRVKEADVILAFASVNNRGWVREEYLPYRDDLEDRGWNLDAGIYIRSMAGIGYGRARLIEVPRSFWKPDKLPIVWKQTRETISEVLRRLAEYGLQSPDLLPSTNSLVPLFVLHQRWGQVTGYHFRKAFHWFLLANRDGRYSGSAVTSLNEDVRAIAEAGDFDTALGNLMKRLRISHEISADEFINRYDRAGNRFLRLMLYLLLSQNVAVDWVDGSRIGYDKTGSPITTGFQPQWHHIFPRSVLSKAKVPDDDINALANITVLNERTNVNKLAAKVPWQYIQEFSITVEALRSHLVPDSFARAAGSDDLKKYWDVPAYNDFLLERVELLAQEANTFLHKLEA